MKYIPKKYKSLREEALENKNAPIDPAVKKFFDLYIYPELNAHPNILDQFFNSIKNFKNK